LQVLLNEPGYYRDVQDVFRVERFADRRIARIAGVVASLCEKLGDYPLADVLAKFEDVADTRVVTDLVYRGARVGNFADTVADAGARLRRMGARRAASEAAVQRQLALEHAGAGAKSDGASQESGAGRELAADQKVETGREVAAEAGASESVRAVEDDWLRKVHGALKEARDFVPGVPASVRTGAETGESAG
jgi:hypothetical protein